MNGALVWTNAYQLSRASVSLSIPFNIDDDRAGSDAILFTTDLLKRAHNSNNNNNNMRQKLFVVVSAQIKQFFLI